MADSWEASYWTFFYLKFSSSNGSLMIKISEPYQFCIYCVHIIDQCHVSRKVVEGHTAATLGKPVGTTNSVYRNSLSACLLPPKMAALPCAHTKSGRSQITSILNQGCINPLKSGDLGEM